MAEAAPRRIEVVRPEGYMPGIRRFRTRGGGKKKKLTGEQLEAALDLYDQGMKVADLCELLEVAPSTLYAALGPYLVPRDD